MSRCPYEYLKSLVYINGRECCHDSVRRIMAVRILTYILALLCLTKAFPTASLNANQLFDGEEVICKLEPINKCFIVDADGIVVDLITTTQPEKPLRLVRVY